MSTYINPQQFLVKLNPNIPQSYLSSNFYLELLKPMNSEEGETYPYKYSVDNFELPYLTPDKHLSYALFWGSSSLIGLYSIIKVLKKR